MSLNPLASTPHLVLFFALFAAASCWLAWKSSARARPSARGLIVFCRLVLIAGLALLALNPGSWNEQREETRNFWTVLIDRSLSMRTADAGEGDEIRWDEGRRLAEKARNLSADGEAVEWRPFADQLEDPAGDLGPLAADGEATDLAESAGTLLSETQSRAGRFTGAILLTDGRQTVAGDDNRSARTALRARAREAPFYVLPLGGTVLPKDLTVEASRRQFIAFGGQDVTVTARVRAEGLGAIKTEVALVNGAGESVEAKPVELKPAETAEVRFTMPAPEPGVHLFRLETPRWEGERIDANNRDSITVTVIEGRTRIFMAEGAPYWDTKFLAQMIRRQENMQITSVYRLSADRFFRVETGDEQPSAATENVFPKTAAELAEYDLIVFGKGAEYFLDPERLGLLSEFVRDKGGAVLFTRGKPYSGRFEGLEFLEPVTWGDKLSEPFRLQPTAAGGAAGLFGDLLPGPDDPIWSQLPELDDANQPLDLKPFTEVLLEGQWQLGGKTRAFPALLSRRFGRGLVALFNADGLWKWDFFPGEEQLEGRYEEFWSQLIQWAITYSEFLPGQDLSLHLDESILYPGDPVRARVGHRGGAGESGEEAEPKPSLRIFSGEEMIREIEAVRPSDTAPRWEAGISLDEPGDYRIEAFDAAEPDKPGPSLSLTVLPLPTEADQLSADPEFLQEFATASGGRVITEADLPEIVAALDGGPVTVDLAKAVWDPAWDRWWVLLILLCFPALEWFTRRRSGLL